MLKCSCLPSWRPLTCVPLTPHASFRSYLFVLISGVQGNGRQSGRTTYYIRSYVHNHL
ncbi:hypothetical protein BKA67DRAFT_549930 [Truncatella angustata]|uniref:Uncharacterized protein n=1 Tax=Truncatella angustata TaxID=152316 RepID=A0A9P9A5N6_9PEZI|nr:uncharacterized protein BKA67DRAFT_549930 [Truncatella angustata]KAH6661024.1 hypothetical protein BKA67DRAFT_549930 [Truncatella angustata]